MVAGPCVEGGLNAPQHRQNACKLLRLVDRPILLRCQSDARAIGPAPLVRAPEGRGCGPSRRHQLRHGQARRQNPGFQAGDIRRIDRRLGGSVNRVLPDQHLGRHQSTEIARPWSHVAVGQLVPRPRKRIRQCRRVFVEAFGNRAIDRVQLQREVGGEHDRLMATGRVMRIGHRVRGRAVDRHPLGGPRRTFGLFPVKAEQSVEIAVVPSGWRRRPGTFQPAGDGVNTLTGAKGVLPAQTHFLDSRAFRLAPDQRRIARAMAFAESMAPGNQRHGFFVIHRHPGKSFPDVMGRSQGVWVAVRTFRVHVNQAHLHGGQRVLQHAIPRIARIAQPGGFGPPIDILLRLPHIGTTAAKAERLQPHRFDCAIASKNHQVGPGDFGAVFLLERPQQPPRLIEVAVVRPGVQRREALLARPRTATAIAGPVGAGRMPRHPDEERSVVAIIRRPPLLTGGHQRVDIGLQSRNIQLFELVGITEIRPHRVRQAGFLVQNLQVQFVRPPIPVRPHA